MIMATQAERIHLTCVVDDDEIFTYGLKKLMKLRNFSEQVILFKDGRSALNFLCKVLNIPDELPEVILLDINMPVMDGWEFMDEFVSIKPRLSKNITIFMLTSSVLDEDRQRSLAYRDVDDLFIKPISLDDLDDMLEEHFSKKEQDA
jgi:CheY-like chemotaxis protein